MRRLAIINQKGGVGKTTTTVNLGAALARLGHRVLLCDLDPQCNLTVHVDVDPSDGEPSVYEVLRGQATLAEAVRTTVEERLHVLPASVDLAGAELELAGEYGRETLLERAFGADTAERAEGFDFVLVDCPPSLGLLSVNALVACDEVFVPVQTEFFALQGVGKLLEVVELVRERLNPALHISGVVACRYDASTKLSQAVMDELRKYFGPRVLQTVIRRNVKLAEAPSHGRTIFAYDAESRGAEDYMSLAREVLGAEDVAVSDPAPESAEEEAPSEASEPPSPPRAATSRAGRAAGESESGPSES